MAQPIALDGPEPALRLVRAAHRPARLNYEHVALRWEYALATFRHAVESYNTVLSIRAQLRQRAVASPRVISVPTVIDVPEGSSPQLASSDPLSRLTRREVQVAALVARGFTNRQIAEALVITHGTAANHVAHVLEKLNAANRTQVAVIVQTSEQHARDYSS
jgi:DNA-binding NarL/FixJ family response regulator